MWIRGVLFWRGKGLMKDIGVFISWDLRRAGEVVVVLFLIMKIF